MLNHFLSTKLRSQTFNKDPSTTKATKQLIHAFMIFNNFLESKRTLIRMETFLFFIIVILQGSRKMQCQNQ